MKILCLIVGHKPPVYARPGESHHPGQEYGTVRQRGTDGVGRNHADIICECPRCGDKFKMTSIHIPKAT